MRGELISIYSVGLFNKYKFVPAGATKGLSDRPQVKWSHCFAIRKLNHRIASLPLALLRFA